MFELVASPPYAPGAMPGSRQRIPYMRRASVTARRAVKLIAIK
jgi:hypothetical protein